MERECALGRKRFDLLVAYKGERFAIELKTWRDADMKRKRDPITEGLAQIDAYVRRACATAAWWVVFDQRSNAIELVDRLRVEPRYTPSGRPVVVLVL